MIGRLLYQVRAGDEHSIGHDLGSGHCLVVASDAFDDGRPMPQSAAGRGVGPNISPDLHWSGVPAGTRQFVLILEDTDVPLPRPLVHTVALIEPTLQELDEGRLIPGTDGVSFIPAAFRRIGYHGPRPVPGHGVHHYTFHLAALDCVLPETMKASRLASAVSGHVIGYGLLTGTYER